MKISVTMFELEDQFIASCPELEINCYGADKLEAARRIRNVLHFYIKSAEELGLDVDSIEGITIDGIESALVPGNNILSAPPTLN